MSLVPEDDNHTTDSVLKVSDADLEVGSEVQPYVRAQRRRKVPAARRKVVDVMAYSSYMSPKMLCHVRLGLSIYFAISLIVTIVFSFMTEGIIFSCKKLYQGSYFFSPNFFIMVSFILKFALSSQMLDRSSKHYPRRRRIVRYLEHLCLPVAVTYLIYSWMIFRRPADNIAFALVIHNNLWLFLLMMAESWISKIPMGLRHMWIVVIYFVFQIGCVLIFWLITHGQCYIVKALNYDRNILWISYPGYFMSYIICYCIVFAFTQLRDFAGLLGQEILRESKYDPDVQQDEAFLKTFMEV